MKKIIKFFRKIFRKTKATAYTNLLVRIKKVSENCFTVQEYDYDSLDFGRSWGRMWGTMVALPWLLKKLNLSERRFCMFKTENEARQYVAAYVNYISGT